MKNLIPASLLAALVAFFVPLDFQSNEEAPKVSESATPSELIEPMIEAGVPVEPVTGPEPTGDTKATTINIGDKFAAIFNKTSSFNILADQAFKAGDALIDIHFNAYKGRNSGPLMLHSERGLALAKALQREFIEIYDENDWSYDGEWILRVDKSIPLVRIGNETSQPVVISEFGYIDDPKNPIGEYIQSTTGQKRIAQAYRNAARDAGYDRVVLSAGHYGCRGTCGAKYKDYSETRFAFDVINQLFGLFKLQDSDEYASFQLQREEEFSQAIPQIEIPASAAVPSWRYSDPTPKPVKKPKAKPAAKACKT